MTILNAGTPRWDVSFHHPQAVEKGEVMKPDLFQRVVLTRDVSEENLRKGDFGWLIDYAVPPPGGEEGAILEIFNAPGESIAVAIVPISVVATLRAGQVPSARSLLDTGK